tara:strand:- start:1692 stop:2288 length:597 start_codon:yes stop_codon:yes gene_type:complete
MSDENYKEKAERINKSYEKRQAAATGEKGLIIVHTGSGKGKSTAAFGMLLRAVHHGLQAGVVQFVKGSIPSGETEVFKSFGDAVEWHRMGEGFSWITQDQDLDRRAAEKAWERSRELMDCPDIGMVVLDEINVAVRLGQLQLDVVIEALNNKREMLHVVLTGRGAKDELIELADLVTEMKMVKHPYRAGIKAQKGVEF